MASIRTLRRRIKTAQNIAKITRAMEMVAASKMRRAQEAALAGREYSEALKKILDRLASKITLEDHPLLAGGNPEGKVAFVLLSTDKGLCGGLNTNLFLQTHRFLEGPHPNHLLQGEGNPPSYFKGGQGGVNRNKIAFVTIGKKARDYASKSGYELLASFTNIGDRPTSTDVRPIAKTVIDGFIAGEFSEVWVVYPAFVSTLTQESRIVRLLPLGGLEIPSSEEPHPDPLLKGEGVTPLFMKEGAGGVRGDYLFEPAADVILDELLPYYIENRLYQLLLETKASEQSARMVAMKNAHDNAKELSGDLKLTYNRVRQARVTNELLDAISSRMALG